MEGDKNTEIVALCGSTKFKEEFEKANHTLTLEGKVVISVGVFGHTENILLTKAQKEMLDKIHRQKIDMSNSIMVINVNNYISSSTRREIEYAQKTGKRVKYYTDYFAV